ASRSTCAATTPAASALRCCRNDRSENEGGGQRDFCNSHWMFLSSCMLSANLSKKLMFLIRIGQNAAG
ncbi:hypothetical protein, partial [Bradyrhizobium ivorense]|uniref:hypothetical protein n=1 Tax=Bradyrhizobium ivorense TaxID=2511166 RepID=UPI001E53929F